MVLVHYKMYLSLQAEQNRKLINKENGKSVIMIRFTFHSFTVYNYSQKLAAMQIIMIL